MSATLESPDTDSRVTIMTLHKAKGLEFDYVFVPHLQKRARSLQRELIRWHWHGHTESRRLLIAANDDDKESKRFITTSTGYRNKKIRKS